jgi:mercuric ion binding protein
LELLLLDVFFLLRSTVRNFERFLKNSITKKDMKKAFILLLICSLSVSAFSQKTDNKPVTTTFWVAGVCGMCEQTIEAALDAKGILKADFQLSINQLIVTYKPSKISETEIHTLLNEAGYDTEKSTCTEEQYARVHGCCKYRELEKH